MSASPVFSAFFSYSHHDLETDPDLIVAFASALERRVNAKLANARFEIWRDVTGLRTGDKWKEAIETEVRRSHILIALLTPRWIDSEYCRKEFSTFEEVESLREVGDYVVPILARSIDSQIQHFTANQLAAYERLQERQTAHAIATDFLKLSDAERTLLLDGIADDIVGMIDRLRLLPLRTAPTIAQPMRTQNKGLDYLAQNFELVDFVKNVGVLVHRDEHSNECRVRAQTDFVERLYVQGKHGRIQFGVRRAFLTIGNGGPGKLLKNQALKLGGGQSAYYVTLHGTPGNISICMDPLPGHNALADLSLPPDPNDNYLSTIATATDVSDQEELSAELSVALNAEGLYINENEGFAISPRSRGYIKAIMEVVARKAAAENNQTIEPNGMLRRRLPIEELK